MAREFGITERVIYKWKKKPKFIALMQTAHDEFVATHQAKAMRDTTAIVQTLSVKVREGLNETLKPHDKRNAEVMRDFREFGTDMMRELRMFKESQREDFGLAKEKHEINVTGGVQVTQHKTHRVTLSRYLEEAGRVIEVPKALATNPAEAVVKGVEQLLLTTSLAQDLEDEDREAEAALIESRGPKR